jgi:uncharacterized protein with HEPN domain
MTRDLARLHDMLMWARRAQGHVASTTATEFADNTLLQDACVRCLEVIGEAVAGITSDFRTKYPDVPWRKAKGMRDILIHQYGAVDYGIVYETIVVFLPDLITRVETVLEEISQ